MIQKKVLFVVVGLVFGCLGMSTEASAAAYVGTDNFAISEEGNKEAIEILTESGSLEDCPFPLENLTTQQPPRPLEFTTATLRAARKQYRVDAAANLPASLGGGVQWRNNYLVPVGFNWSDNGVPSSVWNYTSVNVGQNFVFHNVEDTGVGDYGTGGYYWRQFRSKAKNGTYLYFWLSAWNLNHLIYG